MTKKRDVSSNSPSVSFSVTKRYCNGGVGQKIKHNRIQKAFENGKAFIPFITCGDPDLETTAAAVRAAVKGGADLIELGIPFSDPTAEGPVIQGANIRALKGGVKTDKVFELAEKTAGRKLAKEMAKKGEARDTAEKRPSILSQLGEKKKEAMEHAPKAKAPGRAVPEAAL